VHLFGGTEYGIDRAGLNAECAADACLFIDNDDSFSFFLFAVFGTQWFGFDPKQISQRNNGGFTTRWTLVDFGFTASDCFSIRPAAGIGALAALGLWQQGINLINYRVAFDFEADRRIAEQNTKNGSDNGEQNDNDS